MLDDDFPRIGDCREVHRPIPLSEMSQIVHELLGMAVFDGQPEFLYRTNRESEQFWFMFHVEQLREPGGEVKIFRDRQLKHCSSLPRRRLVEGGPVWIHPCVSQAPRGEEKLRPA